MEVQRHLTFRTKGLYLEVVGQANVLHIFSGICIVHLNQVQPKTRV